jgi:large conductance mechanosensitive channel
MEFEIHKLPPMKKFIEEYRDFILKGNLLQMAVAFIMGAAFGKLTESFTAIVTSLIGLMGGQPDFSGIKPGGIPVGVFFNTLLNLVIVGFCLFLLMKVYNALNKPKPAPAQDSPDVKLLKEIRDLLKERSDPNPPHA